ncbi:glycosyltransferase family 4 protein [Algibacter lectus]|uniref:Glycosyltransferase n=1 Tax=Algibacter lectus TaxID=221126 RepID=A0A090W430_9FLAO|nr:glycosyltransferase family 4 protein [Algibacter lectus]GAL62282.1 glycosyltransferase [Algibacter lectus]
MKNKILLIGPFPPPISGVSLANSILKEGLQREGEKVNFINTENQKQITGETGRFNLSKLSFLLMYLKLFKIPSSNIIYITIGQTFFGVLKYLPFLIIAKLFNLKTVAHLHGGYLKTEFDNQPRFNKKCMLMTLNLFDYGIVLSKSLRRHLSFFLKEEDIFICPNFYEKALFEIESGEKNYEELRIIFLSNLIEGKGINLLLKALEEINSKAIKIKVAGNIPLENKQVVKQMRRIQNLEYLGTVSGKKKADLLSWGNVFCLPTFYDRGEGQPISIIESMAFGNLILTTRHGGIPDICSEYNAFFVQKNNVQDLKEKLMYLLENIHKVKEKGAYNVKYAKENFTEEKFIQNMTNIFDTCIS